MSASFRKFLLLWCGEFISSIGSGLTAFGLSVYVFSQTGSAADTALVTLLAFLPMLLLSVPASKGWTAALNGQKIETEAFEGSLTEISLVPGENHITMQYRTPGLAAGILLSLTGLGITVYAHGKRRKERKTGEDRNYRSNGS